VDKRAGRLPAVAKDQIHVDRGLPDIVGVHPIGTLHEIQAPLLTVAVEEDRDAGERGAVLPFGQTGSSAEQVGGQLDVRRVAQEVDVATDDLRRREVRVCGDVR